MSETKDKATSKILYKGYWLITKYFEPRETSWQQPYKHSRGWSFKIMKTQFTNAKGDFDWNEINSRTYHCAWCKGKYFGEDENAALEAGKAKIDALIKTK